MTTSAPIASEAGLAGKYLTFVLGQESYGIPVLKIREIIRPALITSVPQMPAYVKGVINLRGRIIPVIDLCNKLALEHAASADNACIVVVQVTNSQQRAVQLGLIVDAVEEVCQFTAADIDPAPEFCAALDTAGILGMAKVKGTVKTLLNIDHILDAGPLAAVRSLLVES